MRIVLCLLFAACTSGDGADRAAEPTGAPTRDVQSQRRLPGGVVYDRFCAKHRPPPSHLVAAFDGRRVVVSDGREEIARIRGRPPVRWSASGALLAVGRRGALWTWDGKRYEGPDVPLDLSADRASWAWSPYGDCAMRLDDEMLDAFHTGAGANSTTLLHEGVQAAAWGPRGRIAVVLEDDGRPSLWIVDLKRSTMQRVSDFEPDTCCVVLGGWTPSGEVLFWAGPGTSIMQDGWPLQSVGEDGRTSTWGRTLPRPDTIAICGEEIAAFTASDRDLQGSRVSLLRSDNEPKHLTKRASHFGLACAPDAASVVVAGDRGLSVVPLDGARVTPLTRPPRLTDAFPEWGPRGILFVRQTGLVRQLSFVATGRPRFTATLVAPPKTAPDLAFDWTATPPDGLLIGGGSASE
jgi:hypothetical protein